MNVWAKLAVIFLLISGCSGAAPEQQRSTPESQSRSGASLKEPDSDLPAAGACAEPQGPVVEIGLGEDTPIPRCVIVRPDQRLELVNGRGWGVTARLATFSARMEPGQRAAIGPTFGEYLAPGVHSVTTDPDHGGGPELWLRA